MKDELERIYSKLDSIGKSLDSVDKTLMVQEAHLEDHIRRTEILEQEVLPIKAHVEQMRGVGKFIFYASLMATILAAALMWK